MLLPLYALFCDIDLCTLLLGEATSKNVLQIANIQTLQHWERTVGSHLENKIKMSLCSILLSNLNLWYDPVRLYLDADSIVFWKSSQRTFYLWISEVVFFLTSEGKEWEEKKEGAATQDYYLVTVKCMQIYSCAAAPLIHTDAQAHAHASVWKYQINILTWDVYWLHLRVGWLLSKVLILLDMGTLWDCPGMFLHSSRKCVKNDIKDCLLYCNLGSRFYRFAVCVLLWFSAAWITIDSEST